MHEYTATLMGRFSFCRGDKPVRGLESRKVQELLCYLLVYRGRTHTRESLANTLWSDLPASNSRAYLRKALWQLQVAVGAASPADPTFILIVEPEWIQVNPNAAVHLDVAVLEQAAAVAHGVPGEAISPPLAANLRQAVELYQGELLDGWYQEWCIFERERLLGIYLGLLDKLMAYCEAHGDYESGLAYGPLILRYDRARELTHQRLMRLHFLAGDRSLALRQYEQCAQALRDELGVAPTPLTTALYASIQSNQLAGWPAQPQVPSATAPDPSLPGLLKELQELSRGITTLYGLLQQKVSALEQALTKYN
jgi:DNA-binding SARP family transcriptional activator